MQKCAPSLLRGDDILAARGVSTCQGYFCCHGFASVAAAAAAAAEAAGGTTFNETWQVEQATETTGNICGRLLKTFLEATAASRDMLVEWREQEDEIRDKKEANKGALASGWRSLWSCLVASVHDGCFGTTHHGSIGSRLLRHKIKD